MWLDGNQGLNLLSEFYTKWFKVYKSPPPIPKYLDLNACLWWWVSPWGMTRPDSGKCGNTMNGQNHLQSSFFFRCCLVKARPASPVAFVKDIKMRYDVKVFCLALKKLQTKQKTKKTGHALHVNLFWSGGGENIYSAEDQDSAHFIRAPHVVRNPNRNQDESFGEM